MEKVCKVCSRCKQQLDISSFNKLSAAKDGLQKYCRICQSAKNKAWMKDNKESRDVYTAVYKEATADHRKEIKRKWDAENFEHRRGYRIARRSYYSERSMTRRTAKMGATPKWLTEEQIESIRLLYWLAEDLYAISGQKYHVDHIVPLQGKNVCGLHVPWNLQILPADINISKSNKH